MKYLFLLFCSFSLLACNSGNNKETNSDEKNATQTNGGKPWSNEDQVNFMNDCIEEAGRNISRDSAQKYCACVLTKAQSVYPDFKEAGGKMTVDQVNLWAKDCVGD